MYLLKIELYNWLQYDNGDQCKYIKPAKSGFKYARQVANDRMEDDGIKSVTILRAETITELK